jgi:hypothetical protein
VLASLLVIPGIWFAWKEDRRIKGLVLAWIFSVIAMHLVGIRQVRYLAFIMPITACLIAPVVQRIMAHKEGLPAMLSILLVTQFTRYSSAAEVVRPFTDFYAKSDAREFIRQYDFPKSEDEKQVLISNTNMLSFTDGRNTPLSGDVYHNLFHLQMKHIADLYQLKPGQLALLDNDSINKLTSWPDGSALLVGSSSILMNTTEWWSAPPVNKDVHQHMLFRSEAFGMTRKIGNVYDVGNGLSVTIEEGALDGAPMWVMQGDWLKDITPLVLNIRVTFPGHEGLVYGRTHNNTTWLLPQFSAPPEGATLLVRYFQKYYVHQNR